MTSVVEPDQYIRSPFLSVKTDLTQIYCYQRMFCPIWKLWVYSFSPIMSIWTIKFIVKLLNIVPPLRLCLWVWCVYLRISLDLSGSGCSSLLLSGQLHYTHLTIRLGEGWNVGKTHIKGKTDFDTILLITFPK